MSTRIQSRDDIAPQDKDLPAFEPPSWTMAELRDAIPPRLFVKSTVKGLKYVARDILFVMLFFVSEGQLQHELQKRALEATKDQKLALLLWIVSGASWLIYWTFQGFIFTGLWIIAHECGHGGVSSSQTLCDAIGLTLHSFLLVPYYSWKITHHKHHMNHASLENDQTYLPKTRKELGLPEHHNGFDYEEILGDTPAYTLFMLIRQQAVGLYAYLGYNLSGQKDYPWWTSHFNHNCVLFTSEQRGKVLLSVVGVVAQIVALSFACAQWSFRTVAFYYFIPWLLNNHWIVMITYLHHTDPDLPHYRREVWNFQRGAAATMDRDFLGFIGRFFFHDISHFHVVHHFFPKMPFYNGEEATKYIREFLGEHYRHSSTPVFQALWKSYNACHFVDNTGGVVFFRDKYGKARFRAHVGSHQ